MDIVAELRKIANEIAGHFPGHSKTLDEAASQLSDPYTDIAAAERAEIPQIPVAESMDLDAAEAEVASDKASDDAAEPTPTA